MPKPGNTTARGYGHQHQELRAAALKVLAHHEAMGVATPCARCGQPVRTGQALDLDHTDDRAGYRGLAHRSCNRRAGAIKSNGRRRRPAQTVIGRW